MAKYFSFKINIYDKDTICVNASRDVQMFSSTVRERYNNIIVHSDNNAHLSNGILDNQSVFKVLLWYWYLFNKNLRQRKIANSYWEIKGSFGGRGEKGEGVGGMAVTTNVLMK